MYRMHAGFRLQVVLAQWEMYVDLWTLNNVGAIATEVFLLALFVYKAGYRKMPAFFVYACCWGPLSDTIILFGYKHLSPSLYFNLYIAQLVVDSVLMFAVLVELAWSLLRPIRAQVPRYALLGIAGLIALLGVLLWPIASWSHPDRLNSTGALFFRLQQTTSLMRVCIFLLMAGFSQALSIGWRDRELQIASGMGLYSLVSLGVNVVHTYQAVGASYHWLDLLGASTYLCVLIYWVVCFATKEAERQEFTPQMRSFLLAAAGASRAARIDLQQSTMRSMNQGVDRDMNGKGGPRRK